MRLVSLKIEDFAKLPKSLTELHLNTISPAIVTQLAMLPLIKRLLFDGGAIEGQKIELKRLPPKLSCLTLSRVAMRGSNERRTCETTTVGLRLPKIDATLLHDGVFALYAHETGSQPRI